MSLSTTNRSLQLLLRLADGKTSTEPILDLPAQKPPVCRGVSSDPLPEQTPEKQGVSSRHIAAFLNALHQDPTLRMHSVMIVRNGKILCQAAFGAQDITLPRMTFSACKSITALAIGILMDDGLLSPTDRLIDLFPEEGSILSRQLMKDLTVAHLLSMQTGNQFNEAACMTEEDWLHGFFSSPKLTSAPGEKFHYNSLNTYILAAIICRLTGMSLTDFLTKRLFAPMGIGDFYWERCPKGTEKGGWGLYMRPEDLAKLGQLIQDDGMYHGQQLVSREFLAKATSRQAEVPPHYGDYNYGWQFWVGREKNTVLFNGMLGQNVLCFRNSGITVVSHAGNDETFQQSNYFRLVDEYFGSTFPHILPKDPLGALELRRTMASLTASADKLPSRAAFETFAGRRFVTSAPRAASAGLLPLTLQAVQNCYSKGLQAITICGSRSKVEVLYEERGSLYHIIAGTKVPHVQTLDFDGNVFQVAAKARFTQDEDSNPVLRLQLDFLETPCTRVLKLILTPKKILLRQEETPCMDQILEMLLTNAPSAAKTVLSTIFGNSDLEYLRWKLSMIFAPALEFTEDK